MEKLIPYSLYLPANDINKLREMAKTRRAASFVRDAISSAFEGHSHYSSGYNKGLRDAAKVIRNTPEASTLLVGSEKLSDILVDRIEMMEDHGK